jgi:hypothetical protein
MFAPGERAATLYADPPWGDSHMKFFATQRKKQTMIDEPPLTFESLLDDIGKLIDAHVHGMVYIEMGQRWTEQTEQALVNAGVNIIATHTIFYKGRNGLLPANLIEGQTLGAASVTPVNFDLSEMQGAKLPTAILKSRPVNSIVFDPCCGMGFTAQAARANSLCFYGNEFNYARANKTAAILST